MMQDFAGKTALVTGSNSGTGKAAAQQLAGPGAHVIPGGRDTPAVTPRPQKHGWQR
jgi:NAD(P)-dependent dehydrogenase (short-subunit alcohol dehydrogenase family)